jgi:hypothetical protein
MGRPKKNKATKPTGKKRGRPAKVKAAPQVTGAVISEKDLMYLASLADKCKTKAAAANGEIGNEIRQFSEDKGLHKAAFRTVVGWRRKGLNDPVALRALLDAVDYYRNAMGVDKLLASDMLKDAPKSPRKPAHDRHAVEGTLPPDGEPKPSNVTNLAEAMGKAIEADKASKVA